ncbi:hypothetical protein BGX38DRAFT_1195455 [Terfezia claveryi]|nr:hypothetical protein BGX38DRAFT_1195455 [Terfezia claveryi]
MGDLCANRHGVLYSFGISISTLRLKVNLRSPTRISRHNLSKLKFKAIATTAAVLLAGISVQSWPESLFLVSQRVNGHDSEILYFLIGSISTDRAEGALVGTNMRSIHLAIGSQMEVIGADYPADYDFKTSLARREGGLVDGGLPHARTYLWMLSRGRQVSHKADEGWQKRFIGGALWGDCIMVSFCASSEVNNGNRDSGTLRWQLATQLPRNARSDLHGK